MTQQTLPFQRHSATSRAAAESVVNAGTLREKVRDFIADSDDGATDEEVQIGLGLSGNTVRPRRRELEKAGHVVDSGRTRATQSGRQAVVWIAKEDQCGK